MAAATAVVAAAFLALLVVGRRGMRSGARAGRMSPELATGLGGAGFLFGALLTAGSIAFEYVGARRLRERLASGDYELVAGRVQNFMPGDRGGHRDESFTVVSGGRTYRYRYRHSDWTPGFHQSAGPVHAGAYVRIADVDGQIARLEIQRE
ncbi:MAG TPA: hypothetical protein VF665_17775 [Longimicrobium sp.]|uniref:hypothetical protein n=1 Tax=Longimicrobium sp. TaxID=2029185 RepID=UPI002EDAE476